MPTVSSSKRDTPECRYKVLAVDDDPTVLKALAAALEFELELDVETCSSAEHALVLLHGGRFHVVCSDYSMPGMNGLELLARVAQLPTPVACLLLTGAMSFLERQGTVDQYVLTKPADPARLAGLLIQLARTVEMKRSVARPRANAAR